MSDTKNLKKRIQTVESLHLFHFWPGHTFVLLSQPCLCSCLDCWQGLFGFPQSNTPSSLPLETLLRNPETVGVATIFESHGMQPLLDLFKQTKRLDGNTILVTNGVLSKQELHSVLPLTDAVCLHLKAVSDHAYVRLTGSTKGLQWAFRTMRETLRRNVHLEVSYQLVPGINSSSKAVHKLVRMLQTLQKTLPLHFLRFYPNRYMHDRAPTRDRVMKNAWEVAKHEHLPFVYRDHLFQGKAKNTYLHETIMIKRSGSHVIPMDASQYKADLHIEGTIRERSKP